MSFSIKDERTDKLIRQLAGMTGENYTRAVMEAVKERIERLSRASDTEKRNKRKRLLQFLEGRPGLRYKKGRNLKAITDELWEP